MVVGVNGRSRESSEVQRRCLDLSAARDSTRLDIVFVEAPEEVPGFVKAELPDKAKWHRGTVRKEKDPIISSRMPTLGS